MLHLWAVFTKRDRTARLLRVADLVFQHPHGLTAQQIARRIDMNVRTVYRDLGAAVEVIDPPLLRDSTARIAGDMAARYMATQIATVKLS